MIDSHKSDEIIEVLKAQPLAIRENVKEVSVDMWGGFQKVIKEVFLKMGLRKIKKWLISARCIFGKTAETIERHIQGICHYFVNRTTSGKMEGINNKIKLIIRQSYGFNTFNSLREKLLACLF